MGLGVQAEGQDVTRSRGHSQFLGSWDVHVAVEGRQGQTGMLRDGGAVPPGAALGAPRPCLSCPCQAGDAHLDPHCKLGSHWWHQCPPNSSPVLTNPSSHSLGVRFFSPFFSPSFSSRSHRDLCKDLGASLGPFGVSRWSPGSVPGGISQGGTDFRQPRTKCCQASFAFFAFSKIKTGKLLVPFPWTLPCPREPGSSWGSPAFTFCKIRAVFYLLFFF